MSGPRSWTHTSYTQRLVFGTDAVDRLPELLKELGGRRVLLVTTAGRLDSEAGGRVVKRLGRSLVSTYAGVRSHVPTTALQAALRQAQADDVDVVVSFGGGSCADLAKGVCFFTEQQAGMPGQSYADKPMLPHVAIPTTYSGAEITPYFGMTDEATHRKQGAGGPTIAPVAVVYDPVLTLDLPPRISAETGMNCLAHGIEAAYSTHRTPEAEAVAVGCIARTAAALPVVADQPDDLTGRVAMLEAAALGGRCLHNATMGVHHGLAQTLGGRTGISHGLANAVLLAHALRFNLEVLDEEARSIGQALGNASDPAGAVDRLREKLGLPATLKECGIDEDELDTVARLAADNRSVKTNPRPAVEDDLRAILDAAY